jgi:hypothetical protein
MAVTTITPQVMKLTGLTVTYAAANTDGSKFLTTGRTFFAVKNTDSSPVNVTFVNQQLSNYGKDDDIIVAVAATTGNMLIGPFPKLRFEDGTGYCNVTYSAITALTVAVVELDGDGI